MKRISPAWLLILLAPAVGELLSGSSPPVEYFQPLSFILLTSLYGSGALLVREIVFRWGKGWPSVLALGAAYGMVEEGWMVKSFFDPAWVDLGKLGRAAVGRELGMGKPPDALPYAVQHLDSDLDRQPAFS